MFEIVSPWEDYQLIDSGNGEKLEKFGKYTLKRPEPQALWSPSLDDREWKKADIQFIKNKENPEKGNWINSNLKATPWNINYKLKNGPKITLKLNLTAFKHIGIFPEQATNWDFIYDSCKIIKDKNNELSVLNLFAYTGGASLAANAAGAQVTHLDSVKPVLAWAKENMLLSNQKDIRWVLDDALGFVKREIRRGKKYQGIILDPPAYGRGPDGEKWTLESQINELIQLCSELIDHKSYFWVLNMYSLGHSPIVAQNLSQSFLKDLNFTQASEMGFIDISNKILPLGMVFRGHNLI